MVPSAYNRQLPLPYCPHVCMLPVYGYQSSVKTGKVYVCGNNVGCIFSEESFSCRFVCIKICNCFLVLRFKCCVCSFGSSIILIRYKDFFKVHSRIYGMNSLCFMNGFKINSPDITIIFITFNENRIQIIINVCLNLSK